MSSPGTLRPVCLHAADRPARLTPPFPSSPGITPSGRTIIWQECYLKHLFSQTSPAQIGHTPCQCLRPRCAAAGQPPAPCVAGASDRRSQAAPHFISCLSKKQLRFLLVRRHSHNPSRLGHHGSRAQHGGGPHGDQSPISCLNQQVFLLYMAGVEGGGRGGRGPPLCTVSCHGELPDQVSTKPLGVACSRHRSGSTPCNPPLQQASFEMRAVAGPATRSAPAVLRRLASQPDTAAILPLPYRAAAGALLYAEGLPGR